MPISSAASRLYVGSPGAPSTLQAARKALDWANQAVAKSEQEKDDWGTRLGASLLREEAEAALGKLSP